VHQSKLQNLPNRLTEFLKHSTCESAL
jgi:hypothetical protein